MNKDVYVYLRVSSSDGSQNLANQNFGILNYVKDNNLNIIERIENECSGTVSAIDRGLKSLLERMPEYSLLIVSEVSRLSRDEKNRELMMLDWYCQDHKVSIYDIKDNRYYGYKKEGYSIADDIQLIFKSHESGNFVKQVKQRTNEALSRCKQDIKEKGFFVSKKSGRKITKLGNPDCLKALEKARNVSAIQRASAVLDNPEVMKVYDIIKLKRSANETYSDIAVFLESRGYKTTKGGLKWFKSSVKNLEVRVEKLQKAEAND